MSWSASAIGKPTAVAAKLAKDFAQVKCTEPEETIKQGVASIMATYGSSVSFDAAAVEKFRLALVKKKQARLLKKVFQKDVRWSLAPEASVIIKGEKLSKPLLALYSQCQVVKPKTPSLTVREK